MCLPAGAAQTRGLLTKALYPAMYRLLSKRWCRYYACNPEQKRQRKVFIMVSKFRSVDGSVPVVVVVVVVVFVETVIM